MRVESIGIFELEVVDWCEVEKRWKDGLKKKFKSLKVKSSCDENTKILKGDAKKCKETVLKLKREVSQI